MEGERADELITDLMRSAWIVEKARASVYRSWSNTDPRFAASAARADAQARLFEVDLEERGRAPDLAMVEAHAGWIANLVGEQPSATPFADLFVARLGDWVEAHASRFLATTAAGELATLAGEERARLVFPDDLPPPADFEPLEELLPEPPGDVRFRFGILSDLHVGSERGEAMTRAAIAGLNVSGAELVVQLGDVTDHGNKEEFEAARKALETLEMPWETMMGNHDVLSYEEDRLAGREYFAASFGREADGKLLDHKGVKFAILDSAEEGASPFPPFNLITGQFMEAKGGAIVRGSFTTPQHDILAEIAGPGGGPAFVFLHHPPQPFTSFPPIVFGLQDIDTQRLHATCASGNVWGVFAGHTHRNARPRTFDGVPVLEVAVPRDFPFGYALVDVTAGGYAYHWHQLSDHDLLRDAFSSASTIHRRYALGPGEARAFAWKSGQ